jgi:hypothetical protein
MGMQVVVPVFRSLPFPDQHRRVLICSVHVKMISEAPFLISDWFQQRPDRLIKLVAVFWPYCNSGGINDHDSSSLTVMRMWLMNRPLPVQTLCAAGSVTVCFNVIEDIVRFTVIKAIFRCRPQLGPAHGIPQIPCNAKVVRLQKGTKRPKTTREGKSAFVSLRDERSGGFRSRRQGFRRRHECFFVSRV